MALHNTANKYGLFTATTYNCIGDPYNEKDVLRSSRSQGLNMKASLRKTGKTNDVCFDKFKPLYETVGPVSAARHVVHRALDPMSASYHTLKAPLY